MGQVFCEQDAATAPGRASHRPVTPTDIRRLPDTATAIATEAGTVAEASCANWPELARALGGSAAGAAAMVTGHRQHWSAPRSVARSGPSTS